MCWVGYNGGVRTCILTRSDLFPTNHGAAVKIVRTAEQLSLHSNQPVFVVTDDRDRYLRFDGKKVAEVAYPPRIRAAEEWPPLPRLARLADRLCGWVGYPQEEYFLYRPIFDPTWWLRAMYVGMAEQVDVFQAEFPGYGMPALLASRLRRLLAGVPAQASIVQHNVEWDRLEEFGHSVQRIRMVEQALLRAVDSVIAVSEDDRRRMVAGGLPAAQVTVIPHGVDVGVFQRAQGTDIRQRYDISSDAPLLFFHGTLHYWPNTEAVRHIAEQLLPRLLKTHPDLRVLISGMNPPMYYAHPAIRFTGAVDDLADHIAAADVCICPLRAGGGTRLKLMEYMAAGKPIVSTAKGAEGIPYTDGDNIWVADGDDTFADAVAALLADPALRRQMGHAAGRFAAQYDWSSVTRSYVDVYTGHPQDWAPAPVIDDHLPPRVTAKPLTMLLLINRGCNLRCTFCDLWDNPKNMPLEQLHPLLDDAQKIGVKTLVITGGEPLIHPDLPAVVRAARQRGMGVNITTNGLLVRRHWPALRDSGVSSLSFSIDGHPETHDRLRGQQGACERTWAAIAHVREQGMPANVYFVATKENVRELVDVYERAKSLGCGFDFWPVNDAPELYIRTKADVAAWKTAVAHIAQRESTVAARHAFYEEGMAYHAGTLPENSVRCLGLIEQFGVTFDGQLLPCCVWGGEGLAVGNVFETPLAELWYSPAVQQRRHALYGEGCTAGCFNHSLYEFTEALQQPFRLPT